MKDCPTCPPADALAGMGMPPCAHTPLEMAKATYADVIDCLENLSEARDCLPSPEDLDDPAALGDALCELESLDLSLASCVRAAETWLGWLAVKEGTGA